MDFRKGQNNDLRHMLSDEFWSGKRWAIIDRKNQSIESQTVMCFNNYSTAAKFCCQHPNRKKCRRIFLLAEILKVLNGKKIQPLCPASIRELFDLVSRHPITMDFDQRQFYHFDGNCIFPVIWNKTVNPPTCIETFKIVLTKRKKNGKRQYLLINPQTESEIAIFTDAVAWFKEVCKSHSVIYDAITLIGQFQDKNIEVDNNGIPLRDTGVAFLVSKSQKTENEHDLLQLNDPLNTLNIPVTMFAKYIIEKHQIHFYDGFLKKILPGRQTQFMDLRYYSSVLKLVSLGENQLIIKG